MPFNAVARLAALPEDSIRALGGSEGDVGSLHFVLTMMGIEEFNAVIAAAVPGQAEAASELVTVYRGTKFDNDLKIAKESGYVMSDAARTAYLEARGAGAPIDDALNAARAASEAAHAKQLQTWGSLNDYIQAHGAFGTEISQFGQRSLISWTTDPSRAAYFAGPDSQVWTMTVPRADLIPQTLQEAGESEFFTVHMTLVGVP
jgi:hypothetical protein